MNWDAKIDPSEEILALARAWAERQTRLAQWHVTLAESWGRTLAEIQALPEVPSS